MPTLPPEDQDALSSLGFSEETDELVRRMERLTFLLGKTMRRVKVEDRESSTYGTGAGFHELIYLKKHGPSRLSEVAASLNLDTSTVSRQVKQLEYQGLVARTPDASDARAFLIQLSEKGDLTLAELIAKRYRVMASVLSEWPLEQALDLLNLLEKFISSVSSQLNT